MVCISSSSSKSFFSNDFKNQCMRKAGSILKKNIEMQKKKGKVMK